MSDYIGNELELFKHAVNWKNYFSSSFRSYVQGKTLEVGAGIGINTEYLFSNRATSWTFVEPDGILAEKIVSNTAAISIPKNIVVGTIDCVLGETFDTIIYIDVLEHIEKSKEEIIKIKKMLNPGGHLIILVPAYQYLYNEFDARIGHFRRYNKSILRGEINFILKEKELFYLDSCGVLASLANKLILKKSEINVAQVKFWDRFLVNASRLFDILFFRKFGKSLIGVYQKL